MSVKIARSLTASLLLSVWVGGCAGHDRLNQKCEWTNDAASPLDLRKPADERHLGNDAMVAEELAIRYADVARGRRSGHFAGMDEYVQTRARCMAKLLGVIANNHRVDPRHVRELPAIAATTVMSAIVSVGAVMAFGMWVGTVEMIRVGDTHMSYRVGRLPWAQRQPELLIAGVLFFWLIAVVRWWVTLRASGSRQCD